jgi:hypothetical protein
VLIQSGGDLLAPLRIAVFAACHDVDVRPCNRILHRRTDDQDRRVVRRRRRGGDRNRGPDQQDETGGGHDLRHTVLDEAPIGRRGIQLDHKREHA